MKPHILRSITLFSKKHCLFFFLDKVETQGRTTETIDENKTWRMRITCWLNKTKRAQNM
jgi:hypothetical protein